MLHRAPESFVVFSSKFGGVWRELASVRVEDLARVFPELLDELREDGYASINSFYRPGTRNEGRSLYLPGLDAPNKRKDNLRTLNATFTDLDGHAAPLPEIAAGLQARGVLPWATFEIHSGRGLWLFWLLDPPESAWAGRLALWEKVQTAILERIRAANPEACPDPGSKDASRVCRVPGSLNSKADTVVRWAKRGCGSASNSYTLDALAAFFGVEVCEPAIRLAPGRKDGPDRKPLNGWRALHEQRLGEFEWLRALRGGFAEGTRHHAGRVLAVLLACNGHDWPAVRDEVERLYRECKPPINTDCGKSTRRSIRAHALETVRGVKGQSRDRWKVRDLTLARELGVTAAEVTAFEGKMGKPLRHLHPAPPAARQPRNRAERAAVREGILRAVHATGERLGWGVRELADEIGRRSGERPSPATVARDLDRLGLSTRGGRQRRAARGVQLRLVEV